MSLVRTGVLIAPRGPVERKAPQGQRAVGYPSTT